jgi:hypothetical protein
VKVLEELQTKLKGFHSESFNNPYYDIKGIEMLRLQLYQLVMDLGIAINTQVMTKAYGVETAKKIMAGKFEIGLSKTVCNEIAGIFFKAKVSERSAKTETWEVRDVLGPNGTFLLLFEGDTLTRIIY